MGEVKVGEDDRSAMKLNQSVQRAVAILRAAAAGPGATTASDLARAAGLPWATAVRLIRTLEHEGLLVRVPGGDGYVPGAALAELGGDTTLTRAVAAIALPHLEPLVREIEETINLTVVRTGGQLDVVEQLDPPRVIRAANYIGRWYPDHASSIGKLLLAEYDDDRIDAVLVPPLTRYARATIVDIDALREDLARIRRDGYATAVDELEDGLAALSTPILRADGTLVAMLSATGPTSRFDERKRSAALARLRASVAAIERALDPAAQPLREVARDLGGPAA